MNSDSGRQKLTSVLIVDDSPVDRMLAGNILTKEGLTPHYAENGVQALVLLAQETTDVVLTDLQMPEMDGLTLVRESKQRFPWVPIILMTGRGSEEIAVEALRTGAASYVPKRNLKSDLPAALSTVLAAVETRREQEQLRGLLQCSEFQYQLGFETGGPKALVNHLQESLAQLRICDEAGRLRVGTALVEALVNAVDHGNLELDSKLREDGVSYRRLRQERLQLSPYCDRRVQVTARFTPHDATFVIRDDGPGFDPAMLPDPTDPENLTRPSGRGVMLIRTFMDEVHFNGAGNEITLVKRRSSSPKPTEDENRPNGKTP
jgi:CheY-like chemotaxis protein